MTVDYVELEALMYDHHFVMLIVAFMGQPTPHNPERHYYFEEAYEKAKVAMAKLRETK
jgi:hypothetical protein